MSKIENDENGKDASNGDSMMIALQSGLTSIMQDVESGVGDELGSVRSQVEQIQHLLKDAIATLYDSFEQLEAHSSEQMNLMDKMLYDTTGEDKGVLDGKNIFQRTNDASDLLRDMVARDIESSEQVLTAFIGMDKLKPRIKAVEEEIKHSAGTVNAMAALTDIEGDDSARLMALIEQEKSRLQNLETAMHAIYGEFAVAHRHIHTLSRRDIKDIYKARDSVEQLLKHIYDVDEMISACRLKVTDANDSIRKDLGALIRSLQFEDLVGQSLAHTLLHLDRMDGLVKLVAGGVASMQSLKSDNIVAYAEQLEQLQHNVAAYRQELLEEEHNPVSQQDMDEGDVDLF